jgi:hypothetical protein
VTGPLRRLLDRHGRVHGPPRRILDRIEPEDGDQPAGAQLLDVPAEGAHLLDDVLERPADG